MSPRKGRFSLILIAMRLLEEQFLPTTPLWLNFWAHALIGLGLLWGSERLGKLLTTYRNDYQPITSLFPVESSVGFNAVYRVLFTPLSIVGVSIVLYLGKLDWIVVNIWTVSVWFFLLQLFITIVIARWTLVHKVQFFLFHALSIATSFFLYDTLISKGLSRLLPDETNLRTDLWIIVVLFLYGLFYAIRRNEGTSRRTAYALKRARKFRKKYDHVLQKYPNSEFQDALVAVMIYEDFNRPFVMRQIENLTHAHTRTIMQVSGVDNDEQGIIMTAEAMKPYFAAYESIPASTPWERRDLLRSMFNTHNPDAAEYADRVMELFDDVRRDKA